MLRKNDTSEVSFPDPNGLRNGIGLRVWANGNRYEGTFRDDFVHGEGSLQKAEGGKYSGDFRNGERHGMGLEVRTESRSAGWLGIDLQVYGEDAFIGVLCFFKFKFF